MISTSDNMVDFSRKKAERNSLLTISKKKKVLKMQKFGVAVSRRVGPSLCASFRRPVTQPLAQSNFRFSPRFYAVTANAPLAEKFTVNGDRLW